MVEQIEISNEQIINCENRLIKAISTGEIDPIDVLLTDSGIFEPSFNRKEDLFNRIANDAYQIKISDVSTSDRSVMGIDDFTFVTVTFNLKEHYFEQSIEKRFKYLIVYKFHENRWRVMVGSGFQI